jgi:sulfate transport system substrate-binding protein
VVDKVVDKKGTRGAAEDYLKFIYTPVGQDIAARGFYRPRDPEVVQKFGGNFPKVELLTVDEAFGGWRKAQSEHFNDGGVFDSIYTQ